MQDNTIFALDIGTRSVIGIVGVIGEDKFTALDYERRFHRHGAMKDGQIEDIYLTSKAVTEVKEALEKRGDICLEKTSIAAAGRSLITVRASFEQDIPSEAPVTEDLIHSLEYGALSAAVDSYADTLSEGFSCVGYSVTGHWLDGYRYSNLLGHQGKHVKTDIIAAFLPFSVIRSLYAVAEQCGLTVDSLTLEPIAAINAVVPADIRLLNVAIVDIGAGTSDIAISKDGSIIAYDMVTIAGDELTEAIMQKFLTDFDTAEAIKKSLSAEASNPDREPISYINILGIAASCTYEEVQEAAAIAVNTLCRLVAESILKANETPPAAVFLVGGGSQFPTLTAGISEALGLPQERVALGGRQPYRYIDVCSEDLLSPEFVTPLGIGAAYRTAKGTDFFSITVNEQRVMFPETRNIKVLDALLLAGIKAPDLIGRSPVPLSFTLNGVKRTIRGTHATPGELYVNSLPATLDTPVRQGDHIIMHPASTGKNPTITVAELYQEFDSPGACLINGKEVDPDALVGNGDVVEIVQTLPPPSRFLKICVNGNWIEMPAGESGRLQFVDTLNYVDIDPKHPQGDLVLTLNGKDAGYTDFLEEGDSVEIRWS